jgi:uncharacterized protein
VGGDGHVGASANPAAPLSRKLGDPGELRGEMLYRKFGTTGETVSAIDRGITYLGNSSGYNKGLSEETHGDSVVARWLSQPCIPDHEGGWPHATDRATAAGRMVRRLRAERIDLRQFHEVLRLDDPDRIFVPDRALAVALEARKAGKILFIGFIGHKDPHVHLRMLDAAGR